MFVDIMGIWYVLNEKNRTLWSGRTLPTNTLRSLPQYERRSALDPYNLPSCLLRQYGSIGMQYERIVQVRGSDIFL